MTCKLFHARGAIIVIAVSLVVASAMAATGPEIGCVKWQFETSAAIHQSIAIGADGNVHVCNEEGVLNTLSADGDLLWAYDAGAEITSPPTTGPDGTVFIGCGDGRLHAIDKNGTVRWTQTTGGMIYAAPVVSEDGNIYVGSSDGNLYAIAANGSELWEFTLPLIGQINDSILASPSIGIDGSIYVGGVYGPKLYSLDPLTGSVNWTADWVSGGGLFVSPVVAADGVIYVIQNHSSTLYAIDPTNGSKIFRSEMEDQYPENLPMAHWPFDDNANDAVNSHHGILRNGASIVKDENSPIGTGVLSLDGVDDFVEMLDYKGITGGASRTFSAWIKTTKVLGEIIAYGSKTSGAKWIIRVNGNGTLRAEVEGGYIFGTTIINDETWHHIAVVIENDGTPDISEALLYVDGKLETISGVADEPIDTARDQNLAIGVFTQLSPYSFQGMIDDVRIYDLALSPDQITPENMPGGGGFSIPADIAAEYPDPKCFSEPAIAPDGTIYLSMDDPLLRAVNPDGSIKWATRLGMVGGFTLTVTDNGLIYAACDDGTLYVVDAEGNEISRFDGIKYLSFPVIAPDGTIYISDSGNTLWAINSDPCDDGRSELHRLEDISGDGIVNLADLSVLVSNWLDCTDPKNLSCSNYNSVEISYLQSDIDRNLYVDFIDLRLIAEMWLNNN